MFSSSITFAGGEETTSSDPIEKEVRSENIFRLSGLLCSGSTWNKRYEYKKPYSTGCNTRHEFSVSNPNLPTETDDAFLNSLTMNSIATVDPGTCETGVEDHTNPQSLYPRFIWDRSSASSRMHIGDESFPVIISGTEGPQKISYSTTLGEYKENDQSWSLEYIPGIRASRRQRNIMTHMCEVTVSTFNYIEFAPLYQYIQSIKRNLKNQLEIHTVFHQLRMLPSAWNSLMDMTQSDIPDRIDLISNDIEDLESYQEEWTFEDETKYNDLLDDKLWLEELLETMQKASNIASECSSSTNEISLPVWCINTANEIHRKSYYHIRDEAQKLREYKDYLKKEEQRLSDANIAQTKKLELALKDIESFIERNEILQ